MTQKILIARKGKQNGVFHDCITHHRFKMVTLEDLTSLRKEEINSYMAQQ